MAPFEDYLYKNHRAVFVDTVSETAVDLALLDVLVKNGSESDGWFSSSHPVLVRCGSLGEVGTYAKPDDKRRLQDGLDLFDKCTRQNLAPTYDAKLFRWEPGQAGVADRKFSSSASLKISLEAAGFVEAGAHFSKSNSLTMNIENMETASVDKKTISKLVKGKLWRPTPSELWPATAPSFAAALRLRKTHKVWVVHQILFASKLTVTSAASTSGGAKLACHIVAGTPGAGLQLTWDPAPNSFTLSMPRIDSRYPGKIMFAFRAQCFHFNDAGEFVDMESDAGGDRPMVRADEDEEHSHDKERLDIRNLYLESAPSDVDSEDDDEEEDEDGTCLGLSPLPIRERPVATHKI